MPESISAAMIMVGLGVAPGPCGGTGAQPMMLSMRGLSIAANIVPPPAECPTAPMDDVLTRPFNGPSALAFVIRSSAASRAAALAVRRAFMSRAPGEAKEAKPYSLKSTEATTKPQLAMPDSRLPWPLRQPPAPCETMTSG